MSENLQAIIKKLYKEIFGFFPEELLPQNSYEFPLCQLCGLEDIQINFIGFLAPGITIVNFLICDVCYQILKASQVSWQKLSDYFYERAIEASFSIGSEQNFHDLIVTANLELKKLNCKLSIQPL